MFRYYFCLLALLIFTGNTLGQEGFPKNGVHEVNTPMLITNANIYTPDGMMESAQMLIQDGKIKRIDNKIKNQKGAHIIDFKGKYVYPSFIAMKSKTGVEPKKFEHKSSKPQIKSQKKGPYHWNQAMQPEIQVENFFFPEKKHKEKLRKLGIGTAQIYYPDGIMRGQSLVYTPSSQSIQENIIKNSAGFHFALEKGSSKQTYPSSQMGILALIRQTLLDAQWYKNAKEKSTNLSLEAINEAKNLPQFFSADNKLEVLRILKLCEKFDIQPIVYTGGDDYQRKDEYKKYKPRLILPLKFPDAYKINNPYNAKWISLKKLKHWELAPSNPYFLYRDTIDFVFDISGFKKWEELHNALLKVYQRGLPKDKIIDALTKKPAKWLNIDNQSGALKKGKKANFIVLKKPLFQKENHLIQNWVCGQKFEIKEKLPKNILGKYTLNIDAEIYELEIKGKREKPKGEVFFTYQKKDSINNDFVTDTAKAEVKVKVQDDEVTLAAHFDEKQSKGFQLHGMLNLNVGVIEGSGNNAVGEWVSWNAIRKEKSKGEEKTSKPMEIDTVTESRIWYPNRAYGFDSLPKPETFFIKNLTIWTNEEQGILNEGTVLISDGKIKGVNKKNPPPEAIIIDGKGMHITPGIIDEHSHIAISEGVNEAGQAVSAEVGVGDVIRSDDINIYRQLAGGVTTSQLLHGSANPIGGKSAIIKMRWGSAPEKMKFQKAPGFIKFALGENVKQSNWGKNRDVRYPQTRMGVEQIFYDAFYRAKSYNDQKKSTKDKNFRKDLELETLNEILEEKRFITCHSYVQSEINMLMHVADSMSFTVNTFTHVLEGYKIADKLEAHGAGGSTFSDWWAYKYEVRDAIPYNAALMHDQGVTVAINSDDAEMGRRLNQEAAKSTKYGDLSEEEALKLVTLNPAKLLHIDEYVGSIQEGKHADLVLWSNHPLKAKTKVNKTFVDGRLLFDRKKNEKAEQKIQRERARIIQKMMSVESKTKKEIKKQKKKQNTCNSIENID